MKVKSLSDLLKKGDLVAVSNITGREASEVTLISQNYCSNIMGGWALGKEGQTMQTLKSEIPIFPTFKELLDRTPSERHPNKIIIYSPPGAVYGEVKEVIKHGTKVETIFIITEHVSIEVSAKIYKICSDAGIDVVGCNSLGMINTHERVRVGAVGGDSLEETFKPGSVTIISNSGNMVNTISSYLLSAGMGTAYGISTGKDVLILTPLKKLLRLAEKDNRTKIIVLYVEPGGVYEKEAIEMMESCKFSKPIVVYVSGNIAEKYDISLGHSGAVVEGSSTSATQKMHLFDDYFKVPPFEYRKHYKKSTELTEALKRGIRVRALHHIPKAVLLLTDMLGIKRDLMKVKPLQLNPWFVNLGELEKQLPSELILKPGEIPKPYGEQFRSLDQHKIGTTMSRHSMRNASYASSNDGKTPCIFGHPLIDIMKSQSFVSSLILYWTGSLPKDEYEERLASMTLIASLTNGPGTISAQGAKLSTSAGNSPNTAMIGTLASMGITHGGNGTKAVKFLLECFKDIDIKDPYNMNGVNVKETALAVADEFKKKKLAAKDASIDYDRIPCLGHPVFRNDDVNYDPREQVIYNYIKSNGKVNIFLEFYHELVIELKNNGCTKKVLAVNVDAAIACVWLGICWSYLKEKRMTVKRAMDIPFIAFALGRAGGGAGEYLDHQDYGTEMDMRIPTDECRTLIKSKIPEKGAGIKNSGRPADTR